MSAATAPPPMAMVHSPLRSGEATAHRAPISSFIASEMLVRHPMQYTGLCEHLTEAQHECPIC